MSEPGPPSWLDAAFAQEALRKGGDAGAAVASVELRQACAPGEHYGSAMFRVTAATAAGPRSLIVKTMLQAEETKRTVREAGTFSIETHMLSKVSLELHRILEEMAPGEFPEFSPRCLHHGETPQEFIVLEDLAQKGFRMADRHRGLGLRHSFLALRTLARFHAASALYLSRNPSLTNTLGNPFIKLKSSFGPLIPSTFKMASDSCRKIPNFPQECLEALDAVTDRAYAQVVSVNSCKPGRFNVINHGDFWINNMMFRYEDGEVRDIRLLDFQLSRVTSPAIDILYFLNSSVSEDVSVNHREVLVREYHVTLAETMASLGLKALSLAELLDELWENGFHAVNATVGVLPAVKLEKALGVGDSIELAFTSPTIQRWFRRLLPEHHRRGWLSIPDKVTS